MTEKFCVVAFCGVWIALGWAAVPRIASADAGLLPWLFIAACPLGFWLGQRWASRGSLLLRCLTGLAVCLILGRLALGGLDLGRPALGPAGHGSIHPNDLASLLALILPWWVVSACIWLPGRPRPGATHLAAWVLALAIAAALVWTGSRGGLTAAAVGSLASLLLAARRRRLLVLSLLLATTVAAASLPATEGTRPYESGRGWVRDHDAEGFTWRHLASGRPTIWRQATRLVEDFPLFGTGPHSFAPLVPEVYVPPIRRIDLHDPDAARKPWVDDAHNLYLQSAVAFGLPFLLAFLGLCGLGLGTQFRVALRSRDPCEATTRVTSAAAFGGLLAYLLHGLIDCAAPGTVVYAAGWAMLGHACSHSRSPEPVEAARRRWRLGVTILLLGFASFGIVRWLPQEQQRHRAVDAVLGSGETPIFEAEDTACRDAWWRERLAVARGDGSTRWAATVARCAPEWIADVAALSPTDAERAAAVLDSQPRHPDAMRWRLWTEPTEPAEPLASGYFQLFALRPDDADAKMEFLRRVDRAWLEARPRLFLALLAHACAHGDPGANACYGAGNLSRRLDLGDDVADSFYLASEWPGARRLASEPAEDGS